MTKLEKFNISLEEMLVEKITLTNEAKKEADISVLMDEIDKLDYTEQELKEGLEIFKELLDSVRNNEEVKNYLKAVPDGNFHNVKQIQEWLESYYKKLIDNTPITAAARDEDDRRKEYIKFLKGFRLLGEVMRKKELDPIQLVGNLCTIADLDGVCASGWKYTLIELVTRYRDDIQVKGVMDGVVKLEYNDKELHEGIEVYRGIIESIKDDKEVQGYLMEEYKDMDVIASNIEAVYNKLFNDELSPKLESDNKEQYNKTVLKGLKLFREYIEKDNMKPLDILKNLIKISDLNQSNSEEKVRETITNLLIQFPEEINKKLYNQIKISEETDKIKIRLNGMFFSARENVTKKLCYDFLDELGILISYRPHCMDICTKYLNREYGLNLPQLDLKDSFIQEGSEEYLIIEENFKEYLQYNDIDNLIASDVCRQYSEILNKESKIRQEARDEVTDWANLYVEKNQLIGQVEDTSDFLMEYGYDEDFNVRGKLIEEILEEKGYINKKSEARSLTVEQVRDVIIKALNYSKNVKEFKMVTYSIISMMNMHLISKEIIFDALFKANKLNEDLNLLYTVITNMEQVRKINEHNIYIPVKELAKRINLDHFTDYEKAELFVIAIKNKDIESVIFLQQEMGVNLKNEAVLELLKESIKKENMQYMNILLSNGVDINNLGDKYLREALIAAFNHEEKEILELLLDKGTDVNTSIEGESLLIKSCENGNKEMVELLINRGADINAGKYEKTPLMVACKNGSKDIVELLLDRGADVNENDGNVLIEVCENGNKEMVELLLDRGANINVGKYSKTPLRVACKNGSKDIVELLLDRGADVNENKGHALIEACENGNKEMIELLIDRGADINILHYGDTALKVACKNRNKEIVELLIRRGAEVNVAGGIALIDACKNGNKEMIELLIDRGADMNILHYGDTALRVACKNRNKEMVELLLNKGADVNAHDGRALIEACENENKEMVELLINRGADVNETGGIALTEACKNGNKEIVELLINRGADVNKESWRDDLPLIEAVEKGYKEIVELLLNKGADVNAHDGRALIEAVEKGYKEIVELLLNKGADVNVKKYGITALMLACKNGNKEIVELLINRGADVNIKDDLEEGALYIAVEKGNKEIAKLLIENGVNIKDMNGRIPLEKAIYKGDKEMVELLIKNGADINIRGRDWEIFMLNLAIREKYYSEDKENRQEIIKLLVDNGANLNINDESEDTPLIEAISWGDNETVKLLIDNGVDVNNVFGKGDIPLHRAIRKRYEKTVKLLIDNGVDVNKADERGNTPLYKAINDIEIAKLLVENGAEMNSKEEETCGITLKTAIKIGSKRMVGLLIEKENNIKELEKDGESLLNIAINGGYKEIVKLLIANGADINREDREGFTPLITACEKGDEELVKLLLENEVDVNKQNKHGITALMITCKKYLIRIARLLLRRGVDVNKQNKEGKTALMIACENKNKEMVNLLLRRGADVNKVDKEGKTALMIACEQDDKEVVKALLENNKYASRINELLLAKRIKVNKVDKEGKTALMIACENKNKEIAKILIQNGSNIKQLKDQETKEFVKALLKESLVEKKKKEHLNENGKLEENLDGIKQKEENVLKDINNNVMKTNQKQTQKGKERDLI